MGRNGHTHSHSFESAHARHWPAKGKWSAFYIIPALLVVLLMAGQLAGCDDQSPSPVGQSEPKPAEISLSPLEGEVGTPFAGTLTVEHNEDLATIQVSSPDSSWSYTSEERSFSTTITKNFSEDGVRAIEVTVTDALDNVTEKQFELVVGEQPNAPPFVELSYTTNQIDEAHIRVVANDDNAVERLLVNFGNGVVDFEVNKPSIDTTFIRDYGRDGGSFTVYAKAYDEEGLSGNSSFMLDLVGRADIQLQWRTYLFEELIDGAEFKMSHRTIDYDTTLVSNQGSISAQGLPRGDYDILMIANPDLEWSSRDGYEVSNISRIKLTQDYLPDDYSTSFYRNLGHTYVLSGRKLMARVVGGQGNQGHNNPHLKWILGEPQVDVGFILRLDSPLSTLIETMDNTYDATNTNSSGYLLSELGRQVVHNNGGAMLQGPDNFYTLK